MIDRIQTFFTSKLEVYSFIQDNATDIKAVGSIPTNATLFYSIYIQPNVY